MHLHHLQAELFSNCKVYKISKYMIEEFIVNIYVGKTKLMRISRQSYPVTITIDQKQLENMKWFKYLGSMLTENERCTCEIKSCIVMAKGAFNKNKNLFTWKLDAPGNRSETPEKFWYVVLEKDGDQLDRSCEKWRSVTYSQWAEKYPTWNKKMEG